MSPWLPVTLAIYLVLRHSCVVRLPELSRLNACSVHELTEVFDVLTSWHPVDSPEYVALYALFRESFTRRRGSMDFPSLIAAAPFLALQFRRALHSRSGLGSFALNQMQLYSQRLDRRFGAPHTWSLPQSSVDFYPFGMDPLSMSKEDGTSCATSWAVQESPRDVAAVSLQAWTSFS